MAKAKRDIGLEILEGIREIKRSEQGRVVNVPRPRRARTLLKRARKYIGSVKGLLKPRNVAAQAKALVRGIVAGKHSR